MDWLAQQRWRFAVAALAAAVVFITAVATTGAAGTAQLPRLSVSSVRVGEDGGAATFVIRLSAASAKTVTARFATVDGTATSGGDYAPKAGAVVFKPGERVKRIAVPVLDDAVAEDDESFYLHLSHAHNARVGNDGEAVIAANDLPAVFTATAQLVSSGLAAAAHGTASLTFDAAASSVSFTITLANAPGDADLAHIHSKVKDFLVGLIPVPPRDGSVSGTVAISRKAIIDIRQNTTNYWVEIHLSGSLPSVSGTLVLAH